MDNRRNSGLQPVDMFGPVSVELYSVNDRVQLEILEIVIHYITEYKKIFIKVSAKKSELF